MSVLFMGLSVLPGKTVDSSYELQLNPEERAEWPEGSFTPEGIVTVNHCRAQQEPIVKLMKKKYPSQELTVILLCTALTIGGDPVCLRFVNFGDNSDEIKKVTVSEPDSQPQDYDAYTKKITSKMFPENDGKDWELYNTFAYLLCRLRNSLQYEHDWRMSGIFDFAGNVLSEDKKEPVTMAGCQNIAAHETGEVWELGEDAQKLRVVVVSIDQDAPGPGVYNSVQVLRHYLKGNQSEPFWLDTHGGLRDIIHISNAIVSILREEEILPGKIYGIEHIGQRNRIMDVQSSFYIERFVNGIYDFIDYGRADSLQEYYRSTRDERIKNLLAAMQEISNGTQLCDPVGYTNGLKNLRAALDEIKDGSSNEYLYIFTDLIRRDYGVLAKGEYSTLDIIRRCYNKKLYQQALTFLETYMPSWYIEQKMVIYDRADDPYLKLRAIDKGSGYDAPENHLLFMLFAQMVDSNVLSTKGAVDYYSTWERDGEMEKGLTVERTRFRKKKNEKVFISENGMKLSCKFDVPYKKIKDRVNKDRYLEPFFQKLTDENQSLNSSDLESWPSGKKETVLIRTVLRAERMRNMAQDILVMHKALKDCRNKFNHAASEDRPENAKIIATLGVYIKCCEEMNEHLLSIASASMEE